MEHRRDFLLGIVVLAVLTLAAAPSTTIAAASNLLVLVDTGGNRVLLLKPPYRTASVVLGQINFTNVLGGASQNVTGGQPVGAAMDSQGAIWVADQNNNRVLRFSPPFKNGENADFVIGQSDFTSKTPALSATGLNVPTYLTFDSAGDLWVSDRDNCRVLEYTPPFPKNGVGKAAALVIGQPNFTTTSPYCTSEIAPECSPSQTQTCQTEGITFDPLGNLWVADRGANRVLEFPSPLSTGEAAFTVIGQNNYTSGIPDAGTWVVNQHGLNFPNGIAFLGQNLWVADTQNNRTLEFVPIPGMNGVDATVVLGQPDFMTDTSALTRNGENTPYAIAADAKGNLWVADHTNCRGLQYKPYHGLFTSNQKASMVTGEPNFTTAACATARSRVAYPQGISIGGNP